MNQVAFTAIIPARMGSTRFPGKALATIAGLPMVVHCAHRARESGAERVVIATDHPAIIQAVEGAGFEALLTGAAHETGTDRLAETVCRLHLSPETVVVNVQGDEPLIEPTLIRAVAQELEKKPHCALATACYPIRALAHLLHPNAVKVVLNAAHEALYFSRAPIPWPREAMAATMPQPPHGLPVLLDDPALPTGLPAWHHVGLYAYRVAFLQAFSSLSPSPLEQFEVLEQLRALWHGYRIAVLVTDAAPAPGVDTPEDLERVRALFVDPERK